MTTDVSPVRRELARGSAGTPRDAERHQAKFEAAVYLFELSGEPGYKAFLEADYRSIVPARGPTQWDGEAPGNASLLCAPARRLAEKFAKRSLIVFWQ